MNKVSQTFVQEAETLVQQEKTKRNDAKPSLPIYENMPQCLKDKVWEEGTKKFAPEIEAKQQEAQDMINNATDFEKLKEQINENRPDTKIKEATTGVQDKIKSVEDDIQKAGSLGGITSLF